MRFFLLAALAACQAVHVTAPADTLASLSTFYFGDATYDRAILNATNARAGETGYKYLNNPFAMPTGAQLCIPALQEAAVRRARYETYQRSIIETMLPKPSQVSTSLVKVDTSKPVHVVTWARSTNSFKENGAWKTSAPGDTWVTVVPQAQNFCRKFTADHGANLDELNVRLEQLIGLPPGSGDTGFLELIVKEPANLEFFFRPCATSPATNTSTCAAGPPPDKSKHSQWIFSQYYTAFSTATPNQYPWTALGYTFDWATDDKGNFVRYGASEFIVAKGAPIEVVGFTDTLKYCTNP